MGGGLVLMLASGHDEINRASSLDKEVATNYTTTQYIIEAFSGANPVL